jgi:hypothetical protein
MMRKCFGVLWLAACSSEPVSEQACTSAIPLGQMETPHMPLVWGSDTFSGTPSAWFEVADPASSTGWRLALPMVNDLGLDVTQWNRRDGWSPNAPVVVLPPKPVDPKSLHDERAPTDAVDAAVVLVDAATGQRIRHFEELDLNATDAKRQALLVRAWTPLKEGRTIVVGITEHLRGTDGQPMPVPEAMAALRAGKPCDGKLKRFADDLQVLAKAGVPQEAVVTAWHYHTASSDWTRGVALQAREQTLAAVGEGGLGVTITQLEVDPAWASSLTGLPPNDPAVKVAPLHADVALRVRGKFETPLFLNGTGPEATLNWDGVGAKVKQNGTTWREFVLLVPPKLLAAGGNGRLILYGHGLLRGACVEGCVKPGDAEFMPHLAAGAGAAMVATDWWGLSQPDVAVAVQVPADLALAPRLTDKLVQAAVQPIALTRAVRSKLLAHAWLQLGGQPLVDPKSELVYYGNSLGGIMGTTAVALHPDVRRAVMNVAGAVWSTLMSRSSDFAPFLDIFDGAQPDKFKQQVLFALMQTMWDLSDPANFAHHVVHEPLPGAAPDRRALWPVAWGDAQVANLASGTLQRVAQVPLMAPPLEAWPGVETATKLPLSGSAFVQWDPQRGDYPPGNGRRDVDNGAHIVTRWMPEFQQMVVRFLLQDGQIEPRYCLPRVDDGQLPCRLEEVIPKAAGDLKPVIVTPVPALP